MLLTNGMATTTMFTLNFSRQSSFVSMTMFMTTVTTTTLTPSEAAADATSSRMYG